MPPSTGCRRFQHSKRKAVGNSRRRPFSLAAARLADAHDRRADPRRDPDRGSRTAPARPPELLMVERAGGMAFAGGALVFPGGRIDDADRRLAANSGLPMAPRRSRRSARRSRKPRSRSGSTPRSRPANARWRCRKRWSPTGRSPTCLTSCGLRLDRGRADAVRALGAQVPRGAAVRHVVLRRPRARRRLAAEGRSRANARAPTGSRAAEVLEREQRGEARLIFPTRRNLERLAQHRELRGDPRPTPRLTPIEPVTPWVEERDGEKFITIPDASRLSGDRGEARRALARLTVQPSRGAQHIKKGTRRSGSPS